MLQSKWTLIALMLAAGLAVAGCSDDTNDDSGTNNTLADASNNGGDDAGQDTSSDDVGSDAGQDTSGQQDTGQTDPLLVPDFTYLQNTQGCGTSSCTQGVGVNIGGAGLITKFQNGDGLTENLQPAEIDQIEQTISTEEVRTKMFDGWDCGDATEFDGAQWTFEARARAEDGSYPQLTQNVAGCVDPDSTQPDAQLVQDLIQFLDDVRADHFAPR